MTTSFGTLLSNSFVFAVAHIKPILVGTVILAALTYGGQVAISGTVKEGIQENIGSLEQMEELAERIESGDQEAFQEMMMNIEVMGEMASSMKRSMMAGFVTMIVSLLGYTYFTVLAVTGEDDPKEVASRSLKLIVPMAGLCIWTLIRSFAWIPFIGPIFAIVLLPRLMFGGVILVKEGTGVMYSVKLSYQRTSGYWLKIFGNSLVAFILVGIASSVINITFSAMSDITLVPMAVSLIVSQLGMAYIYVFTVQLADTVMAQKKAS
ncbi:MAG: hypothetical protein QF815_02150 [Candidatus Peribacteraceae bacterium]|jgi:hypothetical protein|nr:hypothetical protein [Candidatus Peribacteraceae bacterium]MDP7477183.1 hypothetical protein [Candidatus Peribacteraceae bacterium]